MSERASRLRSWRTCDSIARSVAASGPLSWACAAEGASSNEHNTTRRAHPRNRFMAPRSLTPGHGAELVERCICGCVLAVGGQRQKRLLEAPTASPELGEEHVA